MDSHWQPEQWSKKTHSQTRVPTLYSPYGHQRMPMSGHRFPTSHNPLPFLFTSMVRASPAFFLPFLCAAFLRTFKPSSNLLVVTSHRADSTSHLIKEDRGAAKSLMSPYSLSWNASPLPSNTYLLFWYTRKYKLLISRTLTRKLQDDLSPWGTFPLLAI